MWDWITVSWAPACRVWVPPICRRLLCWLPGCSLCRQTIYTNCQVTHRGILQHTLQVTTQTRFTKHRTNIHTLHYGCIYKKTWCPPRLCCQTGCGCAACGEQDSVSGNQYLASTFCRNLAITQYTCPTPPLPPASVLSHAR